MRAFDESPWPRPFRALLTPFPLGRWFGVRVLLFPTAAVTVILYWAQLSQLGGLTGREAWGYAFAGAALLYLVVWSHEMGHVLAGRAFGVHTPTISLSALGGVAHMDSGAPRPGAEIVISLAGPAVHGVWLGALLAARPFAHAAWSWTLVEYLWSMNLGLAVFNLLPVFPLDGGRVLRALLAQRMHPNRATIWAARVGIAGGAAFIVLGAVAGALRGNLLVVIGITVILSCLREITAARHQDGPYGPPREPWESDPDAWRGGRSGFEDGDDRPASRRGPGVLPHAGRRSATAVASGEDEDASRRHGRSPADEAELDRLLARVSEVGLSGLSERERDRLKTLSARG